MTRSVPHIRVVVVVRRVVVRDCLTAVSFHRLVESFAVEEVEATATLLVVSVVELRELPEAVDLAGVVLEENVLPVHIDDEVHIPPFGKVLLG